MNILNPELVGQLFAEFQKSFSEITQKSLSEWKSQVRVEAVEATQTQLHFPPQSQLLTQSEEPQTIPRVPVPHIQVPKVLSQPWPNLNEDLDRKKKEYWEDQY